MVVIDIPVPAKQLEEHSAMSMVDKNKIQFQKLALLKVATNLYLQGVNVVCMMARFALFKRVTNFYLHGVNVRHMMARFAPLKVTANL